MAFLKTVHPEFQAAADARHYVENELIRAGAQATIDRVILGNHGAAELAMARAALVLDDYSDSHPNSKDILQWVYYTAPGQVRYMAANLLLKDGGTSESPSYSSIPWLRAADQARGAAAEAAPGSIPAGTLPVAVADPKFRAMLATSPILYAWKSTCRDRRHGRRHTG